MQFTCMFLRQEVTQSGWMAHNALTNVTLLRNQKKEEKPEKKQNHPDFLNVGVYLYLYLYIFIKSRPFL